jgi:NADH dehydrogenase [ubiquinone] 1 alpha subcomplex assembly factor 1
MIHKMPALPLLIPMRSFVMADESAQILFDFTGTDAATEWQTVNDGVMGGMSEGEFTIANRVLEFFGSLSLEYNGGFASVRTKAKTLGLKKGDSLVARVRGDGREYSLNLYLNKPMIAFSYRATLQTKKDEWIEIMLPLDKFEANSFGRPVRDAGPVDRSQVKGLGFLLSDKKAGPFKLEVEWIKAIRAGTTK